MNEEITSFNDKTRTFPDLLAHVDNRVTHLANRLDEQANSTSKSIKILNANNHSNNNLRRLCSGIHNKVVSNERRLISNERRLISNERIVISNERSVNRRLANIDDTLCTNDQRIASLESDNQGLVILLDEQDDRILSLESDLRKMESDLRKMESALAQHDETIYFSCLRIGKINHTLSSHVQDYNPTVVSLFSQLRQIEDNVKIINDRNAKFYRFIIITVIFISLFLML